MLANLKKLSKKGLQFAKAKSRGKEREKLLAANLDNRPKKPSNLQVAKSTLQSSDDDLEQNVLLPPPDPDPDPDPKPDADRFFRLPVCWSINNHDDY